VNIFHIGYVLEVHMCGSINQAAKNLYISQSSLSSAIRKLEGELGYNIFARKNNNVTLTPEGVVFLESAKIIQSEISRIQKIPFMFLNQKNLSFVCNYSSLFMQSLIAYKKNSPDDNVQDFFKETGLINARKDVVEQRYRLGICYCFSRRLMHHTEVSLKYNLATEVLHSNIPVMAILSKRNPLAEKGSLTIDELSAHKLICFEDFEYDDWLGILGIPPTGSVLNIFDRGGMAEAVSKDNYIALMINDPLQTEQMKDCVSLPIAGFEESISVFLLRPRNYMLNKREKGFVRHIKQKLQDTQKSRL